MNKIIHFFDLDGTLWKINTCAWVIDKENPAEPLIRLNKNDLFDLINGVFKNDELLIDYDGQEYWFSQAMLDKIMKNKKSIKDEKRIGLSFIEFNNPNFFKKLDFYKENLRHLINADKNFDLGIISARFSVENDSNLLKALKNELENIGLMINKFYYVCDFFNVKNNDRINFKKNDILLEHLIGFHIKGDHFIPIKQDSYNEIYFYDDEIQNINTANNIQLQLEEYLKNTDDEVFNRIIERIKSKPILYTNLVTNNGMNRFKTTKIELHIPIKFPVKLDERKIYKFRDLYE
jgi:hypothetical protein